MKAIGCFNTQPPEGGWCLPRFARAAGLRFQHTAARRRLELLPDMQARAGLFQHTAARRRLVSPIRWGCTCGWFQHTAARRRLGLPSCTMAGATLVSTHSRPKAAGFDGWHSQVKTAVSTHSRPKAAGRLRRRLWEILTVSTHSRPKAAGGCKGFWRGNGRFQHTAARRRLGARKGTNRAKVSGFNTQPPEGGWRCSFPFCRGLQGFNTQPPEGGWSLSQKPCSIRFRSPDFARLPRKARTRV